MHTLISWTEREQDGVKRETRVQVSNQHLKWQFKRKDQKTWDYDRLPEPSDWDKLEDILRRRAGRGRAVNKLQAVQRLREKAFS